MARKVFLDEDALTASLKAAENFNTETDVVGVPRDKIMVAEKIFDIVNKDFEELIGMFPASTFFELRDNHEEYIDGVCGRHKVSYEFAGKVESKQSPVRRRLF